MSELMKEMQEYIDRYPVTEDERLALLEWVQSGHSVYERCPSRYLPESEEQDFLDIYRQDREIDYDVAGMSCDEMIAYLKDYGYDFELADGWMKNEFIPTLGDSKHFLAVYDLLTMTPYFGFSGNKEDILLQFIKQAPDPGNIRVLGKPVWEIYADFLTRESKGSDAFHNAISYTMSETYKTFYKIFIS